MAKRFNADAVTGLDMRMAIMSKKDISRQGMIEEGDAGKSLLLFSECGNHVSEKNDETLFCR
jgi:hypothetical protein